MQGQTVPKCPFDISRDLSRMNLDVIHGFLRKSYWAADRSREEVELSLRHSLCFGAFCAAEQIGFGRAVSDRAVFAYIADVFVLPEWRGQGIGKALVSAILSDPDISGTRTVLLRTRDAHDLYARFGFRPVADSGDMMALRRHTKSAS